MAGVRECVYAAVLGKDLAQHVRSSKVLVVGAGGIGCELLKNLVLAGFQDIEVVSLSGLNVFVSFQKHVFRFLTYSRRTVSKTSLLETGFQRFYRIYRLVLLQSNNPAGFWETH